MGEFLTLKLDKFPEVLRMVDPRQMPELCNAVVLVAGIDARSLAVPETPVSKGWMFKDGKIGKKTGGRLRSSISGGPDSVWTHNTQRYELHFGTNVKYAGAIIAADEKSKGEPFEIHAKPGKWLVFPISATKVVKTKKVTHPGATALTGKGKGKPLFGRIADFLETNSEKYIKNVAAKFPLLMR
jgi:hypothetical protein